MSAMGKRRLCNGWPYHLWGTVLGGRKSCCWLEPPFLLWELQPTVGAWKLDKILLITQCSGVVTDSNSWASTDVTTVMTRGEECNTEGKRGRKLYRSNWVKRVYFTKIVASTSTMPKRRVKKQYVNLPPHLTILAGVHMMLPSLPLIWSGNKMLANGKLIIS
jgi:hypothetical protein